MKAWFVTEDVDAVVVAPNQAAAQKLYGKNVRERCGVERSYKVSELPPNSVTRLFVWRTTYDN